MAHIYREYKPKAQKAALLIKCLEVIKAYQEMEIKLTLRQLYYQLVAKDIIPNRLSEYKKLTALITDARYGGYISWDAIEDRMRKPRKALDWKSIPDGVNTLLGQYRTEWWRNQDNYVELWCEKDALASVIEPITRDLHVKLSINRGYTSASAIYDAAMRVIDQFEKGKKCTILYLGDHDPSGLDMVRDIQDRIDEITAHHNDKLERWQLNGGGHGWSEKGPKENPLGAQVCNMAVVVHIAHGPGRGISATAKPCKDDRPKGQVVHRETRGRVLGSGCSASRRDDGPCTGVNHSIHQRPGGLQGHSRRRRKAEKETERPCRQILEG